jgi:hypothetical protein
MLKYAFNLLDDGPVGQQPFAGQATRLAYMADEAVEGRDAFLETRDSDCGRFPAILLIYGEQFPPNRIKADLNQATHWPPRVR